MKKIILLFVALGLIFANASAQGCLPQGITFTSQAQIDNFQVNYPGCTEILGDITITGTDITNLNGLIVLTSIWGNLNIGNEFKYGKANPSLTNLTGLDNLTSIGGSLRIKFNFTLTNLTGLDNLNTIGGYLTILGNYSLSSLTGLENLTIAGGIWIWGNYGGMTSLMGLVNLTTIGEDLLILENSALTSLMGLENLASIGGGISISGNNALTSLSELENVTSIGGGLSISSNNALTSLMGLENVTSIGGSINIGSNYSLTSLTGLENVTFISGPLWIQHNNALTSLTGIDNIAAGSITNLNILNNYSLSTCHVQSICDYLSAPNGTIVISNNAPGCNSPEEVIAACETVGIEEAVAGSGLNISPNPFTTLTNIEFNLPQTSLVSIQIFNAMGVKAAELHHGQLPAGQQQFRWDAGDLPKGMYLCRMQVGKEIRTQKIIKVQ